VPARLTDLELQAWQAFLHSHHQVIGKLDAELRAEHGLTLGDYDVLLRLARAPERSLRMTELAQRVMISPSGLTRVVDGLEEEGLVQRRRAGEDARVIFARLTDKGRDLLRRASNTHLRGISEHFTGRLTETQLRQVAAALEVISGPHKPH
jgi:DNA-binding MarR family transcriptional regulator